MVALRQLRLPSPHLRPLPLSKKPRRYLNRLLPNPLRPLLRLLKDPCDRLANPLPAVGRAAVLAKSAAL